MRNIIMSVEGIDGAGKTTLIELMKEKGSKSIHVFPITKGRFKGTWYFQILNNGERFLQSVIGYAVSFTTPVILDRCFLSAYAYSRHNSKLVSYINKWFKLPELQPDIIVFKAVSPQSAICRKQSEYKSEFLQNVYEEYLTLLKQLQQSNKYRFVERTEEELWYLRTNSPCKEVENEYKRIFKRVRALREAHNKKEHS